MRWNRNEINQLSPILERIVSDLAPVDGKNILVLCSALGDVVFWLAEIMEQGKVVGIELDKESLEIARRTIHEMGLEGMVDFQPAQMDRIPQEDSSFDALVSEFVVYPTSTPSQVSQPEMARVLAPGGKMILTDVIVIHPIPSSAREALAQIGLDYLCEATISDFKRWMAEAGMTKVELLDLTPTVRKVWESRRDNDLSSSHEQGYATLLDNPATCLGRAIFYIYVRGDKPNPQP